MKRKYSDFDLITTDAVLNIRKLNLYNKFKHKVHADGKRLSDITFEMWVEYRDKELELQRIKDRVFLRIAISLIAALTGLLFIAFIAYVVFGGHDYSYSVRVSCVSLSIIPAALFYVAAEKVLVYYDVAKVIRDFEKQKYTIDEILDVAKEFMK